MLLGSEKRSYCSWLAVESITSIRITVQSNNCLPNSFAFYTVPNLLILFSSPVISCVRPPPIDNGSHNGDASRDHYTIGQVVTYTCDKDYSLIGNGNLECIVAEDGVNGKWNRPVPVCKGDQSSFLVSYLQYVVFLLYDVLLENNILGRLQ